LKIAGNQSVQGGYPVPNISNPQMNPADPNNVI